MGSFAHGQMDTSPERRQYVSDSKVILSTVHTAEDLKCHRTEKLKLEEKWRRESSEFDSSDNLTIMQLNTDSKTFSLKEEDHFSFPISRIVGNFP